MAGRSLQLSEPGQQQARQALTYLGLTQKALAYEQAIASWSTVSKFFNGKPVDRFIFQEICEVLELDWQSVITTGGEQASEGVGVEEPQPSPPPSVSAATDALLIAVQSQATAAREALTPRILERIPRTVVREKYLPAIARGVIQGQERVVVVIGPAGYGKSTLLGDLYDELTTAETPWVGLVLCSSLSLSTGYRGFMSYGLVTSTFMPMATMPTGPSQNQQSMVASAIGQSLCGELRSVVEVTAELSQTLGRGVLLLDTLDLVINRDFVIVFGTLVRQLVADGTTVVFTCRDYEYSDFLEPSHQRLPGLAQAIERYAVPNFTTAEIRAAAEAFFRKQDPEHPERGIAFADNVLALSADNRSLRDILENPLLLALLCDLFGQEGNVPPDLTVSKLYQRYWREKVVYSRVDQSHFAPLALAKERLCLDIARQLFRRSQTRLQESFYQDELSLTAETIPACNDLLSEGVLTQLDSGKLHFFHQTLLEYAIAYWLTRESAQRSDFFQQVQAENKTHWLPVLRQFLAIVEEAEFEDWLRQLDLHPMGIFGAVAYAAVSRDRPEALRHLLPIALKLGETHQQRLRQALAAAPRQLIETVWDLLISLMQEAEHVTASNTVQMVGSLLERWWRSLRPKLGATLAAIAARTPQVHDQFPNGYDDRSQLLGWLLQPCWAKIQAQPDTATLAALRQQVHLLGHGSCANLIQCHAAASPEVQHDLLRQLLADPLPRYDDIKTALVDWIASLLPQHLAMATFPPGRTWAEMLHTLRPKGWNVILGQAVGCWAGRDRSIFVAILEDCLFGPPAHIGSNLIALEASLEGEAGAWLCPYLLQLAPDQATALNFGVLPKVLPLDRVDRVPANDHERMAQWLRPYVPSHATTLWRLLNKLADQAPTAQQTLREMVPSLPPKLRHQIGVQLLRFEPIEAHPSLATVPKGDQQFLLGVYCQWAATDPAALTKLLTAATGNHNDVAVTASRALEQVNSAALTVEALFPLLRSPFTGVRVNGLKAIASLNQRQPLAAAAMTRMALALAAEANETVGRLFCSFVATWIRLHRYVPNQVLATLMGITQRLASTHMLEGGAAKALVAALKQLAWPQGGEMDITQLGELIRLLLNSIDVAHIKNGESDLLDVLCAFYRLETDFLARVLEHDGVAFLARGWMSNVSV
ncbi:MAG: hypothetical protein AAGF66_17540, partial [Cyanobacteria bacterium P01_H01_bin.119]